MRGVLEVLRRVLERKVSSGGAVEIRMATPSQGQRVPGEVDCYVAPLIQLHPHDVTLIPESMLAFLQRQMRLRDWERRCRMARAAEGYPEYCSHASRRET